MKIVTACFAFVIALGSSFDVMAQITLDRSTLDNVIGTTRTSYERIITDMAAVDAVIADSGADKSWDLLPFNLAGGDSTDLTFTNSLAGTPGAAISAFSSANLIITVDAAGIDNDFVAYNVVTNSDYSRLGQTIVADVDDPPDGILDTLGQKFDTPDRIGVFPLDYGDEWVDDNFRTQFVGPIDFFTVKSRTKTTVDSWGTVTTPTGTHNVLRLHTVTTDSTIFNSIVTSHLYEWLSAEGDVAFLSVSDSGPTIMGYQSTEGTSGTAIDELVSYGVELGRNYPNPFRGQTMIPFELESPGHVKLEIFNLLGQSVAVVADELLGAGPHTASWNGADASTGLYFYRMTIDGKESGARPMTLVD